MMTHLSTVTRIEEGWTNSGRYPYAVARLDCGHAAKVELKPSRGTCHYCGAEHDLGAGKVCCGHSVFTLTFRPNPHNPADRVTVVGDRVACEQCGLVAQQLAWLEALDPATVHHARFRHGSYYLYRLDPNSPSCFSLIGGVEAGPAAEALLAEKGISALSPTERA